MSHLDFYCKPLLKKCEGWQGKAPIGNAPVCLPDVRMGLGIERWEWLVWSRLAVQVHGEVAKRTWLGCGGGRHEKFVMDVISVKT